MSYRKGLILAAAILALLALALAASFWLKARRRVEEALVEVATPRLPLVKTRTTLLRNILSPRITNSRRLANASRMTDGAALRGGFAFASEAGLVLVTREGRSMVAGREGGLPFGGCLSVMPWGEHLVAAGPGGLAMMAVSALAHGPSRISARAVAIQDGSLAQVVALRQISGALVAITRDGAVLLLDGEKFYHATTLPSSVVSAAVVHQGSLVMGTTKGALFEVSLSPHPPKVRLLMEASPDLGEILSLYSLGDQLLVGGGGGSCSLEGDRRLGRLVGGPLVVGFATLQDRVVQLSLNGALQDRDGKMLLTLPAPARGLVEADRTTLIVLTDQGPLVVAAGEGAALLVKKLLPREDLIQVPENTIMAVRAAPDGSLWMGGLNGGLARLAPGAERALPFGPTLVGVDSLVPTRDGLMAVATTRGLVKVDRTGAKGDTLSPEEGIPNATVTAALEADDSLFLATPAGLCRYQGRRMACINAAAGLTSNHLYALERLRGEVAVGSLAGLCFVTPKTLRVRACLGPPEGLPHNWVTALVRQGDNLLAGTYGGSVVRVRPDRSIETLGPPGLNINIGAATAQAGRAIFGTLRSGLLVVPELGEPFLVSEGLASENITSLAFWDEATLAVGTDRGLQILPVGEILPPR